MIRVEEAIEAINHTTAIGCHDRCVMAGRWWWWREPKKIDLNKKFSTN